MVEIGEFLTEFECQKFGYIRRNRIIHGEL